MKHLQRKRHCACKDLSWTMEEARQGLDNRFVATRKQPDSSKISKVNKDGYTNATKLHQVGRTWKEYALRNKTVQLMDELAKRLNKRPSELVRKSGVTWIHPDLVPGFKVWLNASRRERGGLVYAATSDRTDLVKIGRWRGTLEKLHTRYKTVYGKTLQIRWKRVEDCVTEELILHKRFAKYRESGELFDKRWADEYYKCFE